MPESDTGAYEAVTLTLAQTGPDLREAVEAAQYARVINHDEPASEEEATAMATFVAVFADCAETWESVPAPAHAIALDGFGRYLDALAQHGLCVHAGTAERDFAATGGPPRALPLAILHIGRQRLPALTVMLPASIDVTA